VNAPSVSVTAVAPPGSSVMRAPRTTAPDASFTVPEMVLAGAAPVVGVGFPAAAGAR